MPNHSVWLPTVKERPRGFIAGFCDSCDLALNGGLVGKSIRDQHGGSERAEPRLDTCLDSFVLVLRLLTMHSQLRHLHSSVILLCVLLLMKTAFAQLHQPTTSSQNPWSGTWTLDLKRSSPDAKTEAPHAYRLTLGPVSVSGTSLVWEIPELGEVVKGATDGQPMAIHRATPTRGLTLRVRQQGLYQLVYQVYRNQELLGGGRMMLVDHGSAWVDLTWPGDREDLASELIYRKQSSREGGDEVIER